MRKLRYLAGVIALLALVSVFAVGQAETGQITGSVTDPSGAVVPNATVTVKNTGTGLERTITSSSNGTFVVTNLQPGNYEVTAKAQGFNDFKQRVTLNVGGRQTVDAKMGVSTAGTVVEVTAESGTQVNTTDQSLSQVVNSTQIEQLPTITRNPYDLVALSGNVAPTAEIDANQRGGGFAINGQRGAGTGILLDGGENVDLFTAAVGQSVPLDSVQEFRVLTNNYTAEYGRASAGVINVTTKSGTNNYHGSLYEFNRVAALASQTYEIDAQNFVNRQQGLPETPKPGFTRNQFGYSVGGPIIPKIKDKMFFFSSTEWTRVRSNTTLFAFVPTPQFLALTAPNTQSFFNTFGSTLNATPTGETLGVADMSALPLADAARIGATPIFRRVGYNVPSDSGGGNPQNTWSTVNRLDFNITDKTTLYGRYGLQSVDFFPGVIANSPFAGYNTGETDYNQNVLVNLTHVFSPTLISQSKAVYNRLNQQQPLGVNPTGPTLYLFRNNTASVINNTQVALPGYLPFSPGNAIPFGGPQNLYQFYQDVSKTMGAHTFRFGGSYIHTRDNRIFGAYENSVEQLGNSKSGLGVDGLLNGTLFNFSGAVDPQGKFPCFKDPTSGATVITPACTISTPAGQPNFGRNNRFNDGSVYFMDTWKVNPKLTLNAGLRWEYYGVQHNANPNLDSNFYFGPGANFLEQTRNGAVQIAPQSSVGGLVNPSYKNFAPRVGFAYDLSGNGTTAIRGGYGISYERNFGNVTFNVIQNPPNYAVLNINSTGGQVLPVTNSNAGPLATVGAQPLPPVSLRAVDPNINTAYAQQYSLAVEHQLFKNTMMALEYSGSRGVHLYGISNINGLAYGGLYFGDPAITTRTNLQYGAINFRNSVGDSYYNGLNIKVQSTNFKDMGLQFLANYTWSHAIDDLSSTFSESGNNFNLGFTNPFNPGLDRGSADFDIRHRLVLSAVYSPPFFKNSSKLMQNVFGGFEFAPIVNIRTGLPFTVYDCSAALNNCIRAVPGAGVGTSGDSKSNGGVNSYDYINVTNGANPYGCDPTVSLNGCPNGSVPAPFGFSDLPTCTGASCVLPAGIGRNGFASPMNWTFDMGVYKNIKVTEAVGLQLRGEFFNILNHHNFYVNGGTADVSAVSAIETKKGGLGLAFPLDERRNIQLGLKLTF